MSDAQRSEHTRGWIGVDLDGTLAYYESGYGIGDVIGPPLAPMVDRVKQWLEDGREVRILTARASHPKFSENTRRAIEGWCLEHIGQVLPITCVKDYEMEVLYDDRAVQVVRNVGISVTERMADVSGLTHEEQLEVLDL